MDVDEQIQKNCENEKLVETVIEAQTPEEAQTSEAKTPEEVETS